jgi:hypothetical protein
MIIALLGRLTLHFQMRPVSLTESGKGPAWANADPLLRGDSFLK